MLHAGASVRSRVAPRAFGPAATRGVQWAGAMHTAAFRGTLASAATGSGAHAAASLLPAAAHAATAACSCAPASAFVRAFASRAGGPRRASPPSTNRSRTSRDATWSSGSNRGGGGGGSSAQPRHSHPSSAAGAAEPLQDEFADFDFADADGLDDAAIDAELDALADETEANGQTPHWMTHDDRAAAHGSGAARADGRHSVDGGAVRSGAATNRTHAPPMDAELEDGAGPDADDANDDSTVAAEAPRFTKSMHRLASPGVQALKQTRPTSARAPEPQLDVSLALQTILELVERPSSAVAAAFSLTPGVTPAAPRPVPVPAGLQVSVMDPLIDSFDPTLQRALETGDAQTLHEIRGRRDEQSVEDFLRGREVVVEAGRTNFSLGDSRFSPTERSGALDPDILHSVALTGATESALAAGRKAAVQISLSELMDVAGKYHERAMEQHLALHSALSSPLAKRALPNVSARSESAASIKSRQLKELESIFEVIEARGHPRTYHYTLMLNAYAREGFVSDAEKLFADMLASKEDKVPYKHGNFFPDSVACNSMVSMYDRTIRLYVRSHRDEADRYTEAARQVIRTMTQHNIRKDNRTYTAMMTLLCNQLPYATPERSRTLLRESLELFEFMQSVRGGGIKPNRRTFAVLVQGFAISGDHLAAKTLVESMMTAHQIFPSMAVMNGWLRAAAFGSGKDVPTGGAVDVTPVQNIVSLMKKFHLVPNEHSVVSVIRGLTQAGQVQKALELHDHLDDGSLGAARPTRMTYTALLSVLMNDHAQSMATCLSRYERALETGVFKSPLKRAGTVLDLRHVGNHPELYAIALTKQLHEYLRKYMALKAEYLAQPARNRSSPEAAERAIIAQLVPERGWLILTGRHAGDMDLTVTDEGVVLPTGHSSPDGLPGFAPPDDLDHLRDEFPDDGDYSEWDPSGKLAKLKKKKEKRVKRGVAHPLLPNYKRGPERLAHALNTLQTIPVSNAYGRVANKFLLSQTPSIKTTLMKQFAKQEDPQKQRREAQEREAREQEQGIMNTAPRPTAAADSATGAAGAAPAASGADSSAPSKPRRVKKGWPWVPWSLRGPEGPAKTETPNEGMLIVRRPELHFWLQCHQYVLQWHEEARETRRRIDAEIDAAVGAGAGAGADAAAQSRARRSNLALVVPRPAFLEGRHDELWWSRMAESIEVQHGLAVLQSTYEAQNARDEAEEQKRRYAEWRNANAWRGTRRDGSVLEPKAKAKAVGSGAGAGAGAESSKDFSRPSNKAAWSVRGRTLMPKKAPKKRKPKFRVA